MVIYSKSKFAKEVKSKTYEKTKGRRLAALAASPFSCHGRFGLFSLVDLDLLYISRFLLHTYSNNLLIKPF